MLAVDGGGVGGHEARQEAVVVDGGEGGVCGGDGGTGVTGVAPFQLPLDLVLPHLGCVAWLAFVLNSWQETAEQFS